MLKIPEIGIFFTKTQKPRCPSDSWALSKKEVRWMEIANKRRLDGSGILDGYEVGIFVILSLGLVS